jgi:tetratricopeptide (TPR) repeat protein
MPETVPPQPAPDTGATARPAAEFQPPEDPEALLARANALRAKRRWIAAERTYRQVDTAQANAQQRYVALVAAAAIALQHLNSPGRALSFYQSALALTPHGNLDEQALYGIADCYRALDNPAAELEALQRLMAEHSTGVLAESAKRRVATLTAETTRQP